MKAIDTRERSIIIDSSDEPIEAAVQMSSQKSRQAGTLMKGNHRRTDVQACTDRGVAENIRSTPPQEKRRGAIAYGGNEPYAIAYGFVCIEQIAQREKEL